MYRLWNIDSWEVFKPLLDALSLEIKNRTIVPTKVSVDKFTFDLLEIAGKLTITNSGQITLKEYPNIMVEREWNDRHPYVLH